MKKIAFFDAKPYDRQHFDAINPGYRIVYYDVHLNKDTAPLARGCQAACAFVNDEVDKDVIDALVEEGCTFLALRCAGFSNVDLQYAKGKLTIARVPAYSPHAVAEFAFALLLTVNRKTHKAYIRTRDFNFSLVNLIGTDLYGKTAGVIGTGRIGQAFIQICKGFGMNVLTYDPHPVQIDGVQAVELDELLAKSDVISLHCPLTPETRHIIDAEAFTKMKVGSFLINTSRGALVDTGALLCALNNGILRGAGLDVYEEEAQYFYEDKSEKIITDDKLSLLLTKPNVMLSSHQAYLTEEALSAIARTTYENLDAWFASKPLVNEVHA
ncbi:MAG: 2-hydroxyacid dehydrogenase [Sphaerochaetaceae bacterium]|jgi:D-lactate dehydrogenase